MSVPLVVRKSQHVRSDHVAVMSPSREDPPLSPPIVSASPLPFAISSSSSSSSSSESVGVLDASPVSAVRQKERPAGSPTPQRRAEVGRGRGQGQQGPPSQRGRGQAPRQRGAPLAAGGSPAAAARGQRGASPGPMRGAGGERGRGGARGGPGIQGGARKAPLPETPADSPVPQTLPPVPTSSAPLSPTIKFSVDPSEGSTSQETPKARPRTAKMPSEGDSSPSGDFRSPPSPVDTRLDLSVRPGSSRPKKTPVKFLSLRRMDSVEKDMSIMKPEIVDSDAFIHAQKERILTLHVFLVGLHLKKSMKVAANFLVQNVLIKISKHLPSGTDHSQHGLFLPSSAIWLSPERPLYSYVLSEDTCYLEYSVQPKVSEDDRTVKLSMQLVGKQEFTEEVTYSPQTTVWGVVQLVNNKPCEHTASYGVFLNDVLLEDQRPLSSYRLKLNTCLVFRPKMMSVHQSNEQLILKVLLVESSGQKLVKCSKNSTIRELKQRISVGTNVNAEHLEFYGVYIPLGGLLDDDKTLSQIGSKNHDTFEFKKLPPHIIQRNALAEKQKKEKEQELKAFPPVKNVPVELVAVPLIEWTVEQVQQWLSCIGLDNYKAAFLHQQVRGDTLIDLTPEELKEDLGIEALGVRKLIARSLEELKRAQASSSPPSSSSTSSAPSLARSGSSSFLTASGSSISPLSTSGSGSEDEAVALRSQTMRGWRPLSQARHKLELLPLLSNASEYIIEDRAPEKLHASVVHRLLVVLRERQAWLLEGIFRISGTQDAVLRVWHSLGQANPFFNCDTHDIAGALKRYFREITVPVIPFEFYPQFINCQDSSFEDGVNIGMLKETIKALPDEHYLVLDMIAEFCTIIAKYADPPVANKMHSRNLAIVFGPTVIRSRNVAEDFMNAAALPNIFANIIDHYSEIFAKNPK